MRARKENLSFGILAMAAFLCLGLSSCAFKKDEAVKKETEPAKAEDVLEAIEKEKAKEAANGILTEENVKVEFVENPEPSSYRMIVRWPVAIRQMSVRLNGGETVLRPNMDFVEFSVVDNREYKIELVAHSSLGGGPISTIVKTVNSPKDIVVDGASILKEDQVIKANRVFFLPVGQIQTNGFQLSIDAQKVYFGSVASNDNKKTFLSSAQIVTFPLNTPNTNPVQLNGSTIRITAKEAHGELRVALIGVVGTTGAPGLPLASEPETRPHLPALPQHAGRDGVTGFKLSNCSTIRIPGGADFCYDEGGPTCEVQATSGLKGSTGLKGAQGGRGGPGGAAGTLELNIENHSDLKVKVVHKAGAAGAGGPGGRGNPGTLGGRPGARPGLCASSGYSAVSAGPPGDQGPNGDTGPSGDDGAPVVIKGNGVPYDATGP